MTLGMVEAFVIMSQTYTKFTSVGIVRVISELKK